MKIDFPISALHPKLAELITNVSKIKKFNLDALATNYLNACGNTLLNAYELQVAKDWVERSNLWTIHVANSGTLKSHVFNSAIMPILQKDRELRDECKINNAQYYEYAKFCKSIKNEENRSDLILEWLSENNMTTNPVLKTQIECAVQNISTEKMYQILDDDHNNGRSILVQYDEISGLFKDFNKFRAGSDEESWLKFWNYYGLKKSRVSEESSNYINETNVSIIGTTQFRALYDIFTDQRIENGNVYRYLFTVDENDDKKNVFEDLLAIKEVEINSEYNKMLTSFLQYYDYSSVMRTTLSMDEDGYKFVKQWRNEMNGKDFGIDNKTFNSIFAKMDSYIFRIAIILNRIRCYFDNCQQDYVIKVEDLKNSSEILNYYIHNTIYILGKIDIKLFQNFSSENELKFYEALPETFTSRDFIDKAMVEIFVSKRTAERKLKKWCELKLLHKKSLGEYYKTS
ncbi:MAG: DUF3987 domain-containing protein [Bacteroidales bacterium]|nr:DUF3987 domain-containing protein [Bacteroidales bacterium]